MELRGGCGLLLACATLGWGCAGLGCAAAGVPVTTSVAADGWYVVRSQNLKVGDDQYAVTVVRVAPDGSRAQFLQQTDKGTTEVATGITITEVPAINVPSAVKQQL